MLRTKFFHMKVLNRNKKIGSPSFILELDDIWRKHDEYTTY